ncbi:MAG TPA: butyrate kinase, partial [Bacteroides graminisolvens]|nr:butyrate kinase [Bacteroides graminisolvens]
IKESVSYIAPVVVYPGEDEMEALAMSAYEALNGILPINDYK